MSKTKGIDDAFKNKSRRDDIQVIMPKRSSIALDHAFNQGQTVRPLVQDRAEAIHSNWEQAHDFIRELSNYVYQITSDINGAVALIAQLGGVDRTDEFNRMVKAVMADIERFAGELVQLRTAVTGKTGFINTPEENTEYIGIMEKLSSFNSYFHGVVHHTMIAITEFSLEAKDRHLAAQAASQPTEGNTENV